MVRNRAQMGEKGRQDHENWLQGLKNLVLHVGLSCPFRLCSLFSLLFLSLGLFCFSFSISSRSLSFRYLLSLAVYAVSSVSLCLSFSRRVTAGTRKEPRNQPLLSGKCKTKNPKEASESNPFSGKNKTEYPKEVRKLITLF